MKTVLDNHVLSQPTRHVLFLKEPHEDVVPPNKIKYGEGEVA